MKLKKINKIGFATTILVLALSILTIGTMIGYYSNAAVRHRDTIQHVRKQSSQTILEEESNDIALGVVKTIIEGMKNNLDEDTPPVPKSHHYVEETSPEFIEYNFGEENLKEITVTEDIEIPAVTTSVSGESEEVVQTFSTSQARATRLNQLEENIGTNDGQTVQGSFDTSEQEETFNNPPFRYTQFLYNLLNSNVVHHSPTDQGQTITEAIADILQENPDINQQNITTIPDSQVTSNSTTYILKYKTIENQQVTQPGYTIGAGDTIQVPTGVSNRNKKFVERQAKHLSRFNEALNEELNLDNVLVGDAVPTLDVRDASLSKANLEPDFGYDVSGDETILEYRHSSWSYLEGYNAFHDLTLGNDILSRGTPALHPNYQYGDFGPNNHTESNNQSAFNRLSVFSGGGFSLNETPTYGYALYDPKMFPGVAKEGNPMIGRLHVYNFDQDIGSIQAFQQENTVNSKEIRTVRTKIYLMEIPKQGAIEVNGSLQIDSGSDFWGISNINIDGDINASGNIDVNSNVNLSDSRLSGTNVNLNTNIRLEGGTERDRDQTGTEAGLIYREKNESAVSLNTFTNSFIYDPASEGEITSAFYEWPLGNIPFPYDEITTEKEDTISKGGPNWQQYNNGVLQADLHIRYFVNLVRFYKLTDEGNFEILFDVRRRTDPNEEITNQTHNNLPNTQEVTDLMKRSIYWKDINKDGGIKESLSLDIEAITRLVEIYLGKENATRPTRGWPIKGIAIYKHPITTNPTLDRISLNGTEDMTKFNNGVSIMSDLGIIINDDFNLIPATNQQFGIIKRYQGRKGQFFPVRPDYFIPTALYAPDISFYETDSNNAQATFTGALSGSDVDIDIANGTSNAQNGSEINIKGAEHPIDIAPIVPIKWQVTYVTEEFAGDVERRIQRFARENSSNPNN